MFGTYRYFPFCIIFASMAKGRLSSLTLSIRCEINHLVSNTTVYCINFFYKLRTALFDYEMMEVNHTKVSEVNIYKTSYELLTNFSQTYCELLASFQRTSYILHISFLKHLNKLLRFFPNSLWAYNKLLIIFSQFFKELLISFLQTS